MIQTIATVDCVANMNMVYNDVDVAGCTYILVDGTVINFQARHVNTANGFQYVFVGNWKGLPASFTIDFIRNTRVWNVCGKPVQRVWHTVSGHSNIVFKLFGLNAGAIG